MEDELLDFPTSFHTRTLLLDRIIRLYILCVYMFLKAASISAGFPPEFIEKPGEDGTVMSARITFQSLSLTRSS